MSDDGKHAPREMLRKIGESATLNSDSSISWPFPGLHENELGIRSRIIIVDTNGAELNERVAWSIVYKSIKHVITTSGGKTAVHPAELLKEADKNAAEFFRGPVKPTVLVTTLSLDSLPVKKLRVAGCEISATKRGKKYTLPERVSQLPRALRYHLESTRYLTVRVKTSTRTSQESVDQSLDALALLRGLWTLLGTYGSSSLRMGTSAHDPIGVIHNGPIHTLHDLNGRLVDDTFWYEPAYTTDYRLFKPRGGWAKVDKARLWAQRRIAVSPLRQDIQQLVIRYARALESTNLDAGFLQLWSLLEKITDTVGSNYDETISRAMWIFKDRCAVKEQLETLRLRRNQLVHAARSGDEQDQIAYLLKCFVEPHILRLISNEFKVNSLSEYGECLSLPTNIDVLKSRRSRFDLAIRARSGS